MNLSFVGNSVPLKLAWLVKLEVRVGDDDALVMEGPFRADVFKTKGKLKNSR